MNKLITKIVALALGMTMAVGVGVAVASSREAVPAQALDTTSYEVSSTALTSSDIEDGMQVAWGTSSTNLAKSIGSNWVYLSTTASEWIVFDVETTTGGFYLHNEDNGYVYSSATKKVAFDSTNKTLLTLNAQNLVYNSTAGKYTYNSSGIRPYTSNTYTSAYLYEVTAKSTDPKITIDDTETEITVSVKENADLEKTLSLSNVTMAELSYDYDDDIILVEPDNANKKITISGVEHTTTATDLLIKKGSTTLFTVHVNVLYDNDVTITGGSSLKQGTTLQLTATSSKDGGTPTDTFTWSSSDTSVATVNASGLVTGVTEGEVTITASSNNYSGTSGTIDLSVTFAADNSIASFYDSSALSNSNGTDATTAGVKAAFSGNSTVISSVSIGSYQRTGKFGGLSLGSGSKSGSVTITMNASYKLKSISIWAAKVDSTVSEPTVKYGTGDSASSSPTKLSNGATMFAKSEVFNADAIPFTYTFASDAKTVELSATSSTKWTIYKVVLCWTTVEADSIEFTIGSSFSLVNTTTKQLVVKVNPLYFNVALGSYTWNSATTSVATVTSAGLVEAKADSGTSVITATASGLTATTIVTAIANVASSVTMSAATVSAGSTADINGVTWAFSKASRYANDYSSGSTVVAYTRGCILLDSGYIQNNTATFFKIKKVIVSLCLAADKVSGYGANLTVVGSNTEAGGSEVTSTNETVGLIKTYTLAEGCDYVKVSSSAKVDFNSLTIEYETPSETIYSVADFILGIQPDRGEEFLGSCNISNGTYLAAKKRMAMLDSTARGQFQTSDDATVASARTRYGYWAANNHDADPYDGELTVVSSSRIMMPGLINNSSESTIIIVIISLVGLTAIGGYFFLRKRKED